MFDVPNVLFLPNQEEHAAIFGALLKTRLLRLQYECKHVGLTCRTRDVQL